MTMRVVVKITVDLDERDWSTAFGTESRSAVRQDVKAYVGNEIQHAGVFGNGEVSAEIDWS